MRKEIKFGKINHRGVVMLVADSPRDSHWVDCVTGKKRFLTSVEKDYRTVTCEVSRVGSHLVTKAI